jgi:signal transduction histidine kinase
MDSVAHKERWRAWLLDRNRRGTIVVLWNALALYPTFGILDYLLAPRSALPVLVCARVLVTVCTLVLFKVVRTSYFDRHPNLISSAYVLLAASGISVMTVFMGGLASTYYAGLSLVIIATGLLFVWPARVVLTTHSLILLSFIVPNLALRNVGNAVPAASNLAFLVAIAIVTGVGQLVLFRAQHDQVLNQARLEETKASLEAAHNQLKQLDSFKSELFANITHEFKTPLAMVLAPLELMLQGETGEYTPAQQATFQSMFRSGLKLLKMIGDLLDLSKLEDSKLRLKVAENDLCEYLRGLVAQVEPLAQRKNISIKLFLEVEKTLVYCDLERIERVFLNLLSNATKFTSPGGHIEVRVRESGNTTLVTVQDDGPGFPPEKAQRIF